MKLDSKYFDRIRVKAGTKPEPLTPECAWEGCCEPGTHRAPRGRDQDIPNEDSRLIEFDEGNLYMLDRLPGLIGTVAAELLTGTEAEAARAKLDGKRLKEKSQWRVQAA